jgi:ABC-type microcin C transport system duplicated ATPase subunit YejF
MEPWRKISGLTELRAMHGREMAVIFQDPLASPNPRMRVREIVAGR